MGICFLDQSHYFLGVISHPLTNTYHIVVPKSHIYTGMGVSGEILGVSGVKI